MKNMMKWMLGAAVIAGGLGLGTATAQAAEFGVYVRGPVAYVPPCPGPGYVWAAGYYSDGYWVPARWNYVGVRYDRDDWRHTGYYGDRDDHRYFRGPDDHRDRDWDRHRDWDRDRDRGRDDRGDHFRR